MNHITDKQLSLCYLILKNKDQDCKDYRRVPTSGWKNNGNAGEIFIGLYFSSTWTHGLTVSLKPCLNLCLFKLLNCSLKRDSNFTPRGSLILYKEFLSFSILIDFLSLYIDFAFPAPRLSLFHSLIQQERKAF